jgi:arylsulfatase A-like enzyme
LSRKPISKVHFHLCISAPLRLCGKSIRSTGRGAARLLVLLLTIFNVWLAPWLPAAEAAAKPNLIFILADDLGYGDLGCFGQQRIKTPHLDRMAAEGMRGTQVYSGSTVCAPSRAVLMTGRHTGHVSVRGNAGKQNPLAQSLRSNDVTVATLLQKAGYHTGLIGKWGLGDMGAAEPGLPWRHGFDYFYGFLNQTHAHNYYPEFLWRNDQRVKLNNVVPDANEFGAGRATVRRDYAADLIADEALKFVRENRARPFFLCFTPTLPHANNEARQLGMEVPELGEYEKLNWPEPQKGHAAMITRLDRDVGRLLGLLKELNLETNTLVIFTSDNGPHREGGNNPDFNRSSGLYRGIKRAHYEGGIRVPTIVRWPDRVPAGVSSDARWWFPDVLPTLAALGGAAVPSGLDGTNIWPVLSGQTAPELTERKFYWEFHEGGFTQAARWRDWKAVRNFLDDPIELYDLARDPGETNNLASAHPEVVAQMESFLKSARTENPDWPVRKGARKPTAVKTEVPL